MANRAVGAILALLIVATLAAACGGTGSSGPTAARTAPTPTAAAGASPTAAPTLAPTLAPTSAPTVAAAPAAAGDAAKYANPVLDQDFPDPTVIRAADGLYYAYATQSVTPQGSVNIQVASSRDLVSWRVLDDALPDGAPWAGATQAYWAPHAHRKGRTYYLYYSAQPDGTEDTHCLGVATSRSPAGPFKDAGEPFYCGDTGADIDPMVLQDPVSGKAYMYWGSGGVITVQELGPDLLGFSPESAPTQLLYGGDGEYEGTDEPVVEGPWVVYRRPYYYLFYSGDNCCAYPAHYAVLVARSKSPTGPFEKLADATRAENSAILEGSDRWNGPGHGSVVTDAAGRDWLAHHAIDTRNPLGAGGEGVRRVMLLEPLTYRRGWPAFQGRKPADTASRPRAR